MSKDSDESVIVWRRVGCRCVLLRVRMSAAKGWRLSVPLARGSGPTPKSWEGLVVPAGTKWVRFSANPQALVWDLPLDLDDWPPMGTYPQNWGTERHVDFRRVPADWKWGLPLGSLHCQHGRPARIVASKNLRDLLASDAREYQKTLQPVFRDLPARAVE